VEAGLPAAGHELVEEYTPLEAGLEWAISDAKGCYTGQEVIARQITYDKVTATWPACRRKASLNRANAWSPQDERPAGTVTLRRHFPVRPGDRPGDYPQTA
jgi:folate-binding protein YgfZ